jgi:hypothetical protein
MLDGYKSFLDILQFQVSAYLLSIGSSYYLKTNSLIISCKDIKNIYQFNFGFQYD